MGSKASTPGVRLRAIADLTMAKLATGIPVFPAGEACPKDVLNVGLSPGTAEVNPLLSQLELHCSRPCSCYDPGFKGSETIYNSEDIGTGNDR